MSSINSAGPRRDEQRAPLRVDEPTRWSGVRRGCPRPVLWRWRSRLRAVVGVACFVVASRSPSHAAVEPTVPQPRGYVSDYVGILDAGTVSELDRLIGELKRQTGAEIAVVVVETTAPLDAFNYAMKIAEAWKPGTAGKDNGVVFLVAVKDRKLYILTGYGVEGVLPDGKVGEIRDRVVLPAFRGNDYPRGIRSGTRAIAEIIARGSGVQLGGQPDTAQPPSSQRAFPLLLVLVLIVAVILVLAASRGSSGPSGFGGTQRRWRRTGFGGAFPGSFGGDFGGGGFGGGGGGFGGFGGGSFGGGGAGGSW